jgi:hypothetical protein
VSVGASSQFFWGWFECPCQLSSERETRLDDKTMQWCWRLASGRAIVCIYIYPNSLTSTKLCKAAGDWQSHQQKLCKAAGDWQSHQQAIPSSWRLAAPSSISIPKRRAHNKQPTPSQPLTRPSSGVSRAPRARPRHVRRAAPRRPGRCTRQSHRACSCHTHTHTHTHTCTHTHTHRDSEIDTCSHDVTWTRGAGVTRGMKWQTRQRYKAMQASTAKQINQSTNQSINHKQAQQRKSINHKQVQQSKSIDQPINQSQSTTSNHSKANQSINQSINQPTNQPINQSTNQSQASTRKANQAKIATVPRTR